MQHHVIVSFGKEQEFEFKFSGGALPEEARRWFDHEFVLECDVATPTGKIPCWTLSVANMRVKSFSINVPGLTNLRNTAACSGASLIRVDVEHYSIGY
jgi:hypothetical protein